MECSSCENLMPKAEAIAEKVFARGAGHGSDPAADAARRTAMPQADFCREQWYSLSLSLTLIRVLTFALRSRKSRGEQAAWRPVASEANPLYCRPTRQGVFRRTDLRVLIEEPLNII